MCVWILCVWILCFKYSTIHLFPGLFVIVAWLSLFLPPESIPGRVAMAMTTLLTLAAMFGAVRQGTPKYGTGSIIKWYNIIHSQPQGQLCLCSRHLDVRLHHLCLLHAPWVCSRPLVNSLICWIRFSTYLFRFLSLIYRKKDQKTEDEEEDNKNGERTGSLISIE